MESSEPPIDKPDRIDYDAYIYTEDWSKNTYIKPSPMLSFMRRVVDWIPNELHRTSVREAMQKMKYESERMSRTTHAHVLGIMKRHLPAILDKGRALMDERSYDQFDKEFNEGLVLAEKIEDECRRRAEERQKRDREGNIVWKVKEKPVSEKAG